MNMGLGRIVTFYSYKGGTGRSMALANIAWILASTGQRVLVIDWDLESPGLHRYFYPLLADKRLEFSEGIIDCVLDYAANAVTATPEVGTPEWLYSAADVSRYASSLEWHFPPPGTIDFVPSGRQDGLYAQRVNTFDWQRFYKEFSGGLFLEALKKQVREQYDYILIDSRTGVSDTSGICTVQMPDDLVVCFTYNMQSIAGTAAVGRSILEQRRTPAGESTIRLWPVAMRVELAERERLERARRAAREHLGPFLGQIDGGTREDYWSSMEVLYHPYYAYEEVLAAVADRPGDPQSLLSAFERITRYLTDGAIARLNPMSEREQREILNHFTEVDDPGRGR